MRKRCSNKGFSLVELVIVIAIMAILIGVMAPQLIKYIEKAKVANDTQIADTLHNAITYALMDPDVNSANDGSELWIEYFTKPNQLIHPYHGAIWIDGAAISIPGNCKFTEAVTEVMGFNPFTTSTSQWGFKSTSTYPGGRIWPKVIVNDSGNSFAVYLQFTDRTGNRNGEGGLYAYDDLENHNCIFVK